MPKDILYPKLVQGRLAIKGFLAGSLIVAGILNPWGLLLQAILFGFGIFVFIDSVMPEGGQLSIGETVFLAVLGGAVSGLVFAFANPATGPWGAILLIAGVVFYIRGRQNAKE